MKVFLLFLLVIVGCPNQKVSKPKGTTVEVKQNGLLKERRYYSLQKQLTGIVFFDSSGSRSVQGDSLCFAYQAGEELSDVTEYHFTAQKYIKADPTFSNEYYKRLFYFRKACPDIYSLNSSYLLYNELGDICNIRSSVLIDGREVRSLEKISQEGDLKNFEYSDLNSKFNNLSQILQSRFYDQLLARLRIETQAGSLVREQYFFENGTLDRKYFYKNGVINNILISILFKDGSQEKIEQQFNYKETE
jgi:hypothetical protein